MSSPEKPGQGPESQSAVAAIWRRIDGLLPTQYSPLPDDSGMLDVSISTGLVTTQKAPPASRLLRIIGFRGDTISQQQRTAGFGDVPLNVWAATIDRYPRLSISDKQYSAGCAMIGYTQQVGTVNLRQTSARFTTAVWQDAEGGMHYDGVDFILLDLPDPEGNRTQRIIDRYRYNDLLPGASGYDKVNDDLRSRIGIPEELLDGSHSPELLDACISFALDT